MKEKHSKCIYCKKVFEKQYSTHRFCSVICANRAHLNNSNPVKLPKNFNEDLAEFMGILFGDGSVSIFYSKIYLNALVDKDYVPFVANLAKRLFSGASVTCQRHKKECVTGVQISSRVVVDYLKNIGFSLSRQVPHWIKKDLSFTKAFIRGLFDTEGSIGFKKFDGRNGKYLYKQLTFTNKNTYLLNFVSKNLVKIGLKPTVNSKKNIYISNPYDIKRFLNIINLHNPKLIQKLLATDKDRYLARFGRGPQNIEYCVR